MKWERVTAYFFSLLALLGQEVVSLLLGASTELGGVADVGVVVVEELTAVVERAKGSQMRPASGLVSAEPLSRMVRSISQAWVGSLPVAPRNATETSALDVTGNQVWPPSTLL